MNDEWLIIQVEIRQSRISIWIFKSVVVSLFLTKPGLRSNLETRFIKFRPQSLIIHHPSQMPLAVFFYEYYHYIMPFSSIKALFLRLLIIFTKTNVFFNVQSEPTWWFEVSGESSSFFAHASMAVALNHRKTARLIFSNNPLRIHWMCFFCDLSRAIMLLKLKYGKKFNQVKAGYHSHYKDPVSLMLLVMLLICLILSPGAALAQ